MCGTGPGNVSRSPRKPGEEWKSFTEDHKGNEGLAEIPEYNSENNVVPFAAFCSKLVCRFDLNRPALFSFAY
jgi:hypothetical protein